MFEPARIESFSKRMPSFNVDCVTKKGFKFEKKYPKKQFSRKAKQTKPKQKHKHTQIQTHSTTHNFHQTTFKGDGRNYRWHRSKFKIFIKNIRKSTKFWSNETGDELSLQRSLSLLFVNILNFLAKQPFERNFDDSNV